LSDEQRAATMTATRKREFLGEERVVPWDVSGADRRSALPQGQDGAPAAMMRFLIRTDDFREDGRA
jgi:hypothetical protein